MKKQKTSLGIVAALLIAVGLTGCGPKVISVPQEKVNLDDYKKENINKNNNIDLIIYVNRAGLKPVIIKIDNQIIQEMSAYTYSYHEMEKGFHWIAANGVENDSFLCKNFTEGKNIVNVDNGLGLSEARFYLKEKNEIDDIDEDVKQIVQKDKYVKAFTDGAKFDGIKVETQSTNEKMLDLKQKLNKNFEEVLSTNVKNDNLTIQVSLIDFKDGNSFGRWMFGGMDEAKKYADTLAVKIDVIHNNKVIDTFYSSKAITGGIFGGFTSAMIKDLADEITSYMMCKYYQKQFPVKVINDN